jgi:nitroreductase
MTTVHDLQNEILLVPPSSQGLDADFSDASMTLQELLRLRRSSREFDARALPLYTLSRLLWAACGVNRPAEGKRTAPSARGEQAISVYVAQADGLYLFEPSDLVLRQISAADLRGATGLQDFVAAAPLNLVYVASLLPYDEVSDEEQLFMAAMDTGFISENVYLFCAAEGLATVVRGWIDRPALAAQMGLGGRQHIIAAQTVGYPATSAPGPGPA